MKTVKLFIGGLEKYLGILLLSILTLAVTRLWQPAVVYGETNNNEATSEIVPFNQTIVTQSSFTTKTINETEVIPQKTAYQDDPEMDAQDQEVTDEGADGKIIRTIKVTLHEGKEYDREITAEKTLPAVDKKITRGTKIVWKTLDTSDGQIKYWKKMHVYATHYDSHCLGCDEWTATGMHQGKGVIAVDPKVIKLYSKVYVPGYGLSVAGDTGGAIKGNKIDLGFEDARTAGWSARFVDIYLL